MVLSPIVDGFRLSKVLMAGDSGLNLIYEETLQKMEIDRTVLSKAVRPSEESSLVGRHVALGDEHDALIGFGRITGTKKLHSKWPRSVADTTPF